MANFIEFTNAAFDAMNTGAAITNNIIQNNAVISTRNKKYQLQDAVNKKLQEIQQSSNFENWNTDVANFYGQIKSSMSDKNSPYYCRNNLESQQFQAILDESNVVVKEKVAQMTIAAQNEKDILDTNNSTDLIFQTYAGQEAYDRANEGYNLLFKKGAISRTQYEQQKDRNYLRAYGSMCDKLFNDSFEESLKHGETAETFWQKMKETLPELRATDASGMEKTLDISSYMDSQEKKYKSMYTARQQDMWNESEKKCAQIFDSVMDGATAEERNQARMLGRAYLDRVKYTGQMSPEQLTTWTARFKLEDPSTTKSGASSAFKKLTPKEQMDFYLREAEKGSKGAEGGINSFYNAREIYKQSMLDEVKAVNPDAKWVDVEKAYPECMGFFEEAKKRMRNIPGMSEVINTAENMLGTILNTKDDKKKYEEEAGRAMDIVFDMLAEVDVSNMDKAAVEDYKKRVARMMNSLYGGVLEKQKDYKWLKDDVSNPEVLRNYKEGVFGNEATMAKALQERNANPDLVYKDSNQTIIENYGEDLKAGLTSLEAAEKAQIADYLKYNAGLNINKKDIKGDYEADGVYDVNPNKIYTVVARDEHGRPVDEYQYKFSSFDGKHVTMQRKKKGSTEWETVRTAKQQEKYDSLRETANRAVDDIDVSKVPPFELKNYGAVSGRFSQDVWNEMGKTQKRNIIMSLLKQYPEEMQKWLDEQPNKK